tara:strand:- start:166388 stop:167005 length:618 start_codon:yes stop_codon:yes gene_type:complete
MTTENNKNNDSELQGPFSQMGRPGALDALRHDHHDVVLKKARTALSKIETGKALLAVLDKYKYPVHILKGKEITYIAPDEKSITLFIPPQYEGLDSIMAMALGLGIRELEQVLMGYPRADSSMDDIAFCQRTLTKSVDITTYMCRIADEYHSNYDNHKPLDKVIELGHGEVYQAYKNKVSYDEFVDIFVEKDIEAYENGNTGNVE